MTDTSLQPGASALDDALDTPALRAGRTGWALPLLARLHFYVGLLVGPFLLIAASSGVFYALTPQIEDFVYKDVLFTASGGDVLPLARQIEIAERVVGDTGKLFAVRPAPAPGTTTRIMFTGAGMVSSENRAIFIDPVNGEVRGDLGVYGTSGVLPIRSWIDQFHRGLHLGDAGRLYSELAASWLWIVAIGGLALWWIRMRRNRSSRIALADRSRRRHRVRGWHGTLGAWAFVGLFFFSATGLTWSQYAGGNISVLRAHYGWGTPSVSTNLGSGDSTAIGEHAHHQGGETASSGHVDAAMFDAVLGAARKSGIDAGKAEVRPPAKPGKAWTVTEIDRSWPTQVDAIAIDPRDLSTVDQTRFAEFPLAAKLTRWGIDAHMGVLFGLANQLVLIFFALSLITMVVWGYMMWWKRRPTRQSRVGSQPSWLALLRRAPPAAIAGVLAGAALIGWFLPVMGLSLLAFLALDLALQSGRGARAVR